jgi:hypothetical protein
MLGGTPHENEATIVIAIGRRKPPRPAPALDGKRQEYVMFMGNAVGERIDLRYLRAIHFGRDSSQSHPFQWRVGKTYPPQAEKSRRSGSQNRCSGLRDADYHVPP